MPQPLSPRPKLRDSYLGHCEGSSVSGGACTAAQASSRQLFIKIIVVQRVLDIHLSTPQEERCFLMSGLNKGEIMWATELATMCPLQ